MDLVKYLIEELDKDRKKIFNIIKEVPSINTPANLDKVLNELGWEQVNTDFNGWEPDVWIYYWNKDYNFGLIVNYSGFYWGKIYLYRSDIDEE